MLTVAQADDLSKPKPGDVLDLGGRFFKVQDDGRAQQLTEKERRIQELVGDPSETKESGLGRLARTIADLEEQNRDLGERVRQLENAALGQPLEEVT